ncbi:hypothetical protein T492DRAFT_277362 [Pavlovales sp. CCMP2436]|nr:hypothetical protein T492DRAFT_277362 [Pavlovales sp. CCMP2436]
MATSQPASQRVDSQPASQRAMSTNGLDGGPRGTSGSEIMSALGSSRKQRIFFFTGDDKEIGSHAVKDIMGDAQSVDSVVAWSQCREMLLTSADKRQSVLVMDTERGVTKSELSLRRERKNWNMTVDSIAPMQKWEQYNRSDEIHLYAVALAVVTAHAQRYKRIEKKEQFYIKNIKNAPMQKWGQYNRSDEIHKLFLQPSLPIHSEKISLISLLLIIF